MKAERGAALIIALLLLSFLTVLGGALLSNSTIEIWVSDNYKTTTQNLYLTEAGIDRAREQIRTSGATPAQLLAAAAGINGTLSTAVDLSVLLASDDRPLIPSDPSLRVIGQTLTDSAGGAAGRYHVWLRNDNADGMTAAADSNQVLTLLSLGRVGNARKAIEVTVKKWEFPRVPNALTLDGPVDVFDPSGAAFAIDVADSDAELESRLKTVSGLENIVAGITASAADIYNPAAGTAQTIGNFGSPSNYRIGVVNGNVNLGPGTGYGLLVVRGHAILSGNFTWSGLILVVGQGVLHWNSGGHGSIEGGVFIARTRDEAGTLLSSRGGITADFHRAGGTGIHYNTAAIAAANQGFPYTPIAIKER